MSIAAYACDPGRPLRRIGVITMPLHPATLWASLKRLLAELPPSIDRAAYYRALSGWVLDNQVNLGVDAVETYGLDTLAALEPELYPLDASQASVSDEIANLIRQQPTRRDTIAMFLRDQLWPLVALKADTGCPSCGQDELRTLVGSDCGKPVTACDSCGWSKAAADDGERPQTVRPGTTAELRELGVL